MGDLHIAAIVLAAGFSRRLGRPKQTVLLGGETLVERAARMAREAGLSPVVVVLNRSVELIELIEQASRLESLGYSVLWNEGAHEGMSSSIRCGVQALQDEALIGAVLMTCDQVAVTAEHLRLLCADPAEPAGSGYAGRVAVPAYFPASRFAVLQTLQGDMGARELLRHARCVHTEDLALDVDTEEELVRAQEWLAKQKPA